MHYRTLFAFQSPEELIHPPMNFSLYFSKHQLLRSGLKFFNFLKPLIALIILFLPAAIAVIYANQFADWLYNPLAGILESTLSAINSWPSFLASLFGGNYGLVAMFPFLILYAIPTIIVFSFLIEIYRSSGLIDRISVILQPWLRLIGLGSRDLVRVIMGFGCNVPAIVSSRTCNSCSRGACVSAISFGSACSYQMSSTLAVFAAAGMAGLGIVYVLILTVTTLIYLRFTTPKALRLATNQTEQSSPPSLRLPSWKTVWAETGNTLKQFVVMAFPIFIIICFVAATLDWLNILSWSSNILAPVLALFNLPGDAASAVVLGAVRKDGIAIGLLDNGGAGLKATLNTPAQVMTAVYLAGILLPCLVTVLTIIREISWKFAAKLCARQMIWAAGFGVIIAWGGAMFS